ncbi:MAG: hypothetical protein ABIS68_05795, partial [Casimicrobiaceae bacterium]
MFDAAGMPVADARDIGSRNQAIVSSGASRGAMLFPALAGSASPTFLRLDRSRYGVSVEAVDLSATVQAEREYDFLHFGIALLFAVITLVAFVLAAVNRDRGQFLFAAYFGLLAVAELTQNGVALSLLPDFAATPWLAIATYPVNLAIASLTIALMLRLAERAPRWNRWMLTMAALSILQTPLHFLGSVPFALRSSVDGLISALVVFG